MSQLSDDDLRWLGLRLVERLGGDLGAAVEFMSFHPRADAFLASPASAAEFYDAADKARDAAVRECRRRGVVLKWGMGG